MPTYLYKNTDTGEIYELRQSMRDDAYTVHPDSGVPVKRVLARPSIAFKGSGFYANDSRPRVSEGGSESKSSEGKSGGEGKSAPRAEGKSESSSSSKSGGGSKGKGGGEG